MAVPAVPAHASATPGDLLAGVKKAEAGLRDFKTNMVIAEASKKTISGMGEGYSDIMKLESATIAYKKPDKIRYDGYAVGIKVAYIQNGYTKLILASMVRHKENVKDSPGKRQDTLDIGFLSSRLWTDNNVSLISTDKNGVMKLKLDPKFGGNDKRHDFIWVDPRTLRLLKREKYLGSGQLRISMNYSEFTRLSGGLPIATRSTMFDSEGKLLGTVTYKNLKVNAGVPDSLFSLSARK
jgi:outer membrane lipoprotein-sorting protein